MEMGRKTEFKRDRYSLRRSRKMLNLRAVIFKENWQREGTSGNSYKTSLTRIKRLPMFHLWTISNAKKFKFICIDNWER